LGGAPSLGLKEESTVYGNYQMPLATPNGVSSPPWKIEHPARKSQSLPRGTFSEEKNLVCDFRKDRKHDFAMRSIIQVQKERKMTLNLSRGFRVTVTSFWGPKKTGVQPGIERALKVAKWKAGPMSMWHPDFMAIEIGKIMIPSGKLTKDDGKP
jgi:hypothetical protein